MFNFLININIVIYINLILETFWAIGVYTTNLTADVTCVAAASYLFIDPKNWDAASEALCA